MLPHGNWRAPLRFIVARDDEGIIQAVLPVAEQAMTKVPVLSLAGNYKPFRCLLIAKDAPEDTSVALVHFLTETVKPKAFRLGPVQSIAPEIQAIRRAFTAGGWRACRISRGTEFLMELDGDLEAYRSRVGRKKFQRIRYKQNRLARQGDVRIERHRALTLDAWRRVIADATAVERGSWLMRCGGDPNYADDRMAAFWQGYLSDEAASATASIWILYFDDRPISFNTTIDSCGCRYFMSLAYHEAFKDASPGKIVSLDSIITAFDEGIEFFNMGQGDSSSYKVEWGANGTSFLDDDLFLPPTAMGLLLYLAARAKFGSMVS